MAVCGFYKSLLASVLLAVLIYAAIQRVEFDVQSSEVFYVPDTGTGDQRTRVFEYFADLNRARHDLVTQLEVVQERSTESGCQEKLVTATDQFAVGSLSFNDTMTVCAHNWSITHDVTPPLMRMLVRWSFSAVQADGGVRATEDKHVSAPWCTRWFITDTLLRTRAELFRRAKLALED